MKHLTPWNLLQHHWYKKWESGEISPSALQHYASQYYHHVSAFPRYLSATHSLIEDLSVRQVILENLTDEEKGPENHPELWLRFAEGLGLSREQVLCAKAEPAIQNVIDTFFKNSRASAAQGIGVLYAYESQVPAIAKFKIEALKKYYLTENTASTERALQFFRVHQTADEYHTESLRAVIDGFSTEEKQLCEKAALEGACALWGFLDAMPA